MNERFYSTQVGRLRQGPTIVGGFSCPESLLKAVKEEAKRQRLPVSVVIRFALETYLINRNK